MDEDHADRSHSGFAWADKKPTIETRGEPFKWGHVNPYGMKRFPFRIYFIDGKEYEAVVMLNPEDDVPDPDEILRMGCQDPFDEGHRGPVSMVTLPEGFPPVCEKWESGYRSPAMIVDIEFRRLGEEERKAIGEFYIFAARLHVEASRLIDNESDFDIEVNHDGLVTFTVHHGAGHTGRCWYVPDLPALDDATIRKEVGELFDLARKASL